ncbi:MAG: universal stress protein [candidate division WOR-3 bacterium]|nr:universal stress protein [candidate division WOR-3 bacterium]
MKMFHKIVYTTDLSESSLKLIPWITYLSKVGDSRLEILHVVNSISPFYKMILGWNTILDEYSNNHKHKILSTLESIKLSLKENGINHVDIYLKEGTPHWEIVDFLDYTKASLVVLSNSSKNEEIGSTAYEVSCLSPSNVLIIKGNSEPRIKKIAVGMDFSRYSKNAFILSLALAKTFSAKVYNVHVFDSASLEHLPSNLIDELLIELNLELTKVFEGIDIEPVIIKEGSDGRALTKWAKENDIDIILISYRGLNDRTMFLGHFADEVIRSSQIPVLLVRKFY